MRRSILVAIPVLGLAVMLQTSIIGRINLLNGAADLVLLILAAWGLQERARSAWVWGAAAGLLVGFISGVPWYVYLAGYLVIAGMARHPGASCLAGASPGDVYCYVDRYIGIAYAYLF